jgi:hypothetical protein
MLAAGPVARPPRRARRRLLAVAVAVAGLAVAAIVVSFPDRPQPSAAERVARAYVQAWNARDAQAVSALTCPYLPAFTAAGDVQHRLDQLPADRPVVRDWEIVGEHPDVVFGREGTAVTVAHRPSGGGPLQEDDLFVRLAAGLEPCIGYYVSW